MDVAAPKKICILCGQDCTGRPRTRDRSGRYFCNECFDRAMAYKRRKQERDDENLSLIVVPRPRPAPSPRPASPTRRPERPQSNPTTPASAAEPSAAPPDACEETRAADSRAESGASKPAERALTAMDDSLAAPVRPPNRWRGDPSAFELQPERVQPEPDDEDVEFQSDEDPELPAPADSASVQERTEPESQRVEAASAPALDDFEAAPAAQPRSDACEETHEALAREAPARLDAGTLEQSIELPEAMTPAFTAEEPPREGSESADAIVAAATPRGPQAMLLEGGPPAAAFAGCPNCRRPTPTGAIVCLACGYNVLTGAVTPGDAIQSVARLRPRSGWAGPILLGGALIGAVAAGTYMYFGTREGFFGFALAFLIALPAWFIWALVDARDTERAQLKISLVPGYVFAWIFGESRSRYLRAFTIAVIAIVGVFAAHAYEWNRAKRQQGVSLPSAQSNAAPPAAHE